MDSQKSTKKSRSNKTTTVQYEELIKYMESHSEFAANKYLTKEGKIHHAQQWDELHKMLNALSNGPGKTIKQWQIVWRDLKSNASKKASKIRNEKNRTGNFPVQAEPLDNLEKRVIACMGLEYVQGASDCPDSMPEEEEHQIQLEHGNEIILESPPTTTSIAEILNTENLQSITVNDNHAEALQINEEDNQDPDQIFCNNISPNQEEVQHNIIVSNNQEIPNKTQQRIKEISRNRKSRQRIAVQLQEARDKFSDVAESHARALQLFAEASMKMAEAAQLTAENEKRRIELEERRLLIEERRISIDTEQIKILSNLQKITDMLVPKNL